MMTHETDNTQLTVSYELLLLLRWLIEHEEERVKKLVQKALQGGLHKQIQSFSLDKQDSEVTQELHYSVTDFFNLVELLLAESVSAQVEYDAKQKNLMPTVDQIDSTICDTDTVRSSLERAASVIAKNPDANAKDVLFQELLKNWKPNTKMVN